MTSSASLHSSPVVPTAPHDLDQRIVVYGVSWESYVTLRDTLDIPGLRLTYYKGALELMSPSRLHEDLKKTIARLIEVYALERGVALYGYGSTTFRREAKERGAEPDECYTIGAKLQEFPEIVLEVVLSSGGIDKLAVYKGFEVPEVWFYEDGAFQLFELTPDGYVAVERSRRVPDLDFEAMTRFVHLDDQHAAVVAFRDHLRG